MSSTFAARNSKFRVSFWLRLIFETLGWFSCFERMFSFFIIFWRKGISKAFWCNTRCFFNYIYIMIVEHFNKHAFVFNTVIWFSRDQFVFICNFDILIFFSFDLYVLVWDNVPLFEIKGLTVIKEVLLDANLLFLALYSKHSFSIPCYWKTFVFHFLVN